MTDKETLNALFDLSYGLYIVSSSDGKKLNGQLANSVFQVTAEPAQMAVTIHKNNLTHQYIEKSGIYTVSVLKEATPMTFIGLFGFKSGRDINKFEKTKYEKGILSAPIVVENCISGFEIKVTKKFDVGTHTIFAGDIVKGRFLSEAKPLTYDYYYRVMRGKTPRNATTYKPPEVKQTELNKEKTVMKKYVCKVCGYIYDPMQGDPDNGVEPNTLFENIPDNWLCPVCGVGKDQFEVQE